MSLNLSFHTKPNRNYQIKMCFLNKISNVINWVTSKTLINKNLTPTQKSTLKKCLKQRNFWFFSFTFMHFLSKQTESSVLTLEVLEALGDLVANVAVVAEGDE